MGLGRRDASHGRVEVPESIKEHAAHHIKMVAPVAKEMCEQTGSLTREEECRANH